MESARRIFTSPNYQIDEFEKFEIDEKITVFEDRLKSWIFDVCENILALGIPNYEFAILKITCSCFEMFGKFTKGYQGNDQSKKHFKIGFKAIYYQTYDVKSADLFYAYIRNSIYHTGFVSPNVLLTQSVDKPFGYNENNLLILNVSVLLNDLRDSFYHYVGELRKKENVILRENFETRFDFESSLLNIINVPENPDKIE
jgi:hypothetical protein